MAAAVSILLECTCTAFFSATDQGGGETYSNAITFKADKVTAKESTSSSDHGTAQDLVDLERKTKITWTIDVDTKFYSSTLLAAIRSNDLCQIQITSRTGMGVSGAGLITDLDVDYAGPSTMKFTIKAHGSPISYV